MTNGIGKHHKKQPARGKKAKTGDAQSRKRTVRSLAAKALRSAKKPTGA